MKIKIGTTKYALYFVDNLQPTYTAGEINFTKHTIHVALRTGIPLRARPDKRVHLTMWHELVHAMLHDMGSRKATDEDFVDALAQRIVQVQAQLAEAHL